jgi:hypothetical protein
MLNRFLASLFRGRPTPRQRYCRLSVEQLEDRSLPSANVATPAAAVVQTQALTTPTINGSGHPVQYIDAGIYETVSSETVTVLPGQSGQYQLTFQAQAFAGITNRVGVRYMIDGQVDPNDAVIRAGTAADVVEDIGQRDWATLSLTRMLTLSTGMHTVTVQVYCTTQGLDTSQDLAVSGPAMTLVAFNIVDGQNVAVGTQVQSLTSPASGTPGQQDITAGSYQTVTSATVTVGANKTGIYDLTFQEQAYSSLENRAMVRYLIDGQPDPRDLALGTTGTGADTTEEFSDGYGDGGWQTLLLTHQLVLAPGTHTISVQVECTSTGVNGSDLHVYTPVLTLFGYNVIDGQHAIDGVQTQTPASPVSGAAGQQDLTAGTYQTVATKTITVAGIASGVIDLGFQAQAQATDNNRVYVRYLIDGQPDPNDQAIASSGTGADATFDFFANFGNDAWHTLELMRTLTLTPGTHTISVQVECTQQGAADGQDLVVYAPVMHLTGYNNVTPTSHTTGTTPFSYNATTGVLTITGSPGNDVFKFTQATQAASGGALTTTYTFTLNGASVSYNNTQLNSVIVDGSGGTNTATLYANNTYLGTGGQTQAVQEQVTLGAGGGSLQLYSGGSPHTFLQLMHFADIFAYMGHADNAVIYGAAGETNTLTMSGLSTTMSGNGYSDSVSGAGSVTAYSASSTDKAYLYDGSGPSTFTATGTTSSTMTGTDHGQSFSNTAMGFHVNYGIARHSGDFANLYDSPGNDNFVGQATQSFMDSYAGSVQTMDNVASGFAQVKAYFNAGGNNYSYNYAPSVNFVTGTFHQVV